MRDEGRKMQPKIEIAHSVPVYYKKLTNESSPFVADLDMMGVQVGTLFSGGQFHVPTFALTLRAWLFGYSRV